MGVIEQAVAWAIETANDQSHGYSQDANRRWGPDYDCSSFVISAFEQAGVPLREAGASFTGNMRGPMISCGFADVTYSIGLDTGYGLQPGDVLLNYAAHTCLFIGGGRVANCRTDEGHPQTGDQSGNEIRIQPYWDGSPNRWNCVMRYKGTHIGSNVFGSDTSPSSPPRNILRKGMTGDDVRDLQEKLNNLGYDCGQVDGIFGTRTFRAVVLFQEDHGLDTDGIAGRQTKTAIEAALSGYGETAGDPKTEPEKFWLPDLEIGASGSAVSLLQSALNIRGYNCGKPDGAFGPKTQASLNRFKEARKMEANGTTDRETWFELLGMER